MALLVVAVYMLTTYVSGDILSRLLGSDKLNFTDGLGREERWLTGLSYFRQHPIMGNGWGTFECHNTYITLLVDIGIIGCIPFYYVIFRLFFRAIKYKDTVSLMILTAGLLPSFFVGAQNRRYFWNAIILTSIFLNCKKSILSCSDLEDKV